MTTDLDVYLPAILARDTDAFGQWMARVEPQIRESLRSFARVVDVEAVLQEALLRVWTVAPRFVPDGAPNGLLRLGVRIARNLAISEVRRTRAAPPSRDLDEVAADLPVHATEPDPLLRKVVAECYRLLPEQPRRARRVARGGARDAPQHVPPELRTRAEAPRRVPAEAWRRDRRRARDMTPEEEDLLVETVAGASRPASRDTLRYHPAWHDLGPAARARAFDRAHALRRIEAALDPGGLSTTARAVLSRIRSLE